MTKMRATAAIALLAAALAGPATAATISNVQGVVREGNSHAAGTPAADIQVNDFNGALGDPLLELIGDTTIYGYVLHQGATTFTDAWAIDFGTGYYDTVFNWNKNSTNFDGELTVNGVIYTLGASGSIALGNLTGVVSFLLDPIAGSFAPNESTFYSLEMSEVPLPAGAVLLLSGLAGLAVARRRKTA